jgi:hypothetical protein
MPILFVFTVKIFNSCVLTLAMQYQYTPLEWEMQRINRMIVCMMKPNEIILFNNK